MKVGGIAIGTALGMLACPLFMAVAALCLFRPWRQWTARPCATNAQRVA